MREIISADETEDASSDTGTPDDNSELILGPDIPERSVEDLWPDPSHVFSLWQIYLDRVNPLTKIIHVPTLQPYLAEAVGSPHNLPKNVEALLFSIFIMAAISLTPDECQSLLGYSREEALQRYSAGVKLTLLRMNFLKSNDLTTLQALVIYLVWVLDVYFGEGTVTDQHTDFASGPIQSPRRLGSERGRNPHGTKDGTAS